MFSRYTTNASSCDFVFDILDGMYDWVRVIDRDDNIIYINKAMEEGLGSNPTGQKCFELFGGSTPCENCISRKAVFHGKPHEKEEIIGNKIFSVMCSPIKNHDDEVYYVVEVLRDVTQNKKLQHKILLQNIKLQNDLEMAKRLQCSLLPKNVPQDRIDFSFIYKPCESLGGDFLDIFSIDENHIGIYIADVSGHGVSASMLTVFLRSSINRTILDPAKALEELYAEFNNSNFDKDLYITIFYCILNVQSNTLVYSNAGHNVAPIVFNKDRFEILRTPGIPISDWLDKPTYVNKSVELKSKDKIFLYTDGIIEMKNKKNELFGEENILNILLNSNEDLNRILNTIINTACDFANIGGHLNIPDDITMAILEIK